MPDLLIVVSPLQMAILPLMMQVNERVIPMGFFPSRQRILK